MPSKMTDEVAIKFTHSLNVLEQAATFAKPLYQTDVYQEARRLMETENGMETLLKYADRFDGAGIFAGGPWEDPSKLQPPFVAGSLKTEGLSSIIEILSDLRMLAIANGQYNHPTLSSKDAEVFLNEVVTLNLDLLFPSETEQSRIEQKEGAEQYDRSRRFFKFLFSRLSSSALSGTLLQEIDRLTAQRPIIVKHIISMIKMGKRLLNSADLNEGEKKALEQYVKAIEGPSSISQQHPNLNVYRKEIKKATKEELEEEALACAMAMHETGLVSPYHAVLVRYLSSSNPELLHHAFMLTDKGKANIEEHHELVKQLIRVAIFPATRQCVYGLGKLLDRGVLSSSPVIPGLRRLIELDIQPEVRKDLLDAYKNRDGLTENTILVAGVISVLGQPLGISQGFNPTCQAARGISLWSQHAPGYLLELIPRAARDGDIDLMFDGLPIHSKDLQGGGLAPQLHKELDPVSLVLVPHLDRIYNEMMVRVALRGDDGHRWVNPAFYGNWVQRGFRGVFDPITSMVTNYAGFVQLFYSTHHPDYNDEYEMIYPNPVGIFITTVHGKLLGYHAVTILRIALDPTGQYRIYFYNPNSDGSQNWGQGIEPSVSGNGEQEGESSLPFDHFVARLYAFHYNPYEQGDSFAVEDEIVQKIESLSRDSWGQAFKWLDI